MNCRITLENQRGCPREKGATMLEMAILLPVIVLIVLGIAEFTFWLTADNLANTAAQRAASYLAAAPDIDNTCAATTPCDVRKQAQLQRSREIAVNVLTSTPFFSIDPAQSGKERSFIKTPGETTTGANPEINAAANPVAVKNNTTSYGVDLFLPRNNVGETLEAAFQRQPIEVSVQAYRISFFRPIFGWLLPDTSPGTDGGVLVYGRARAWKEPTFIASAAPALDCSGNIITNPGAAASGGCRCLNDNDPNKEATGPGALTCRCRGQLIPTSGSNNNVPADVDCQCPNGRADTDGDGICETCTTPCGAQQSQRADCGCNTCPSGQIPGQNGACTQCQCPDGSMPTSSGGVCDCVECEDLGQVEVNGICKPCPDGQIADDGTCEPCPDCGDRSQEHSSGNVCSCVPCTASQIFVNGQCQGCPTRQVADVPNNRCVCDPQYLNCTANQVPNLQYCRCDCDPTRFTCGTQEFENTSPNVCGCSPCPLGQVQNAQGTGCQCPTTTACPGTQRWDSSLCRCVDCGLCQVQNGPQSCRTQTASDLQCADGSVIDITQCRCQACVPGTTTPNANRTACVCDYAAVATRCTSGQYVNGSCQCQGCPPGQIRDPSNPRSCRCPVVTCPVDGQTSNSSCQCSCPSGTAAVTCVDRGGSQACKNTAQYCRAGVCYCDRFPPE